MYIKIVVIEEPVDNGDNSYRLWLLWNILKEQCCGRNFSYPWRVFTFTFACAKTAISRDGLWTTSHWIHSCSQRVWIEFAGIFAPILSTGICFKNNFESDGLAIFSTRGLTHKIWFLNETHKKAFIFIRRENSATSWNFRAIDLSLPACQRFLVQCGMNLRF